MVLLPLCLLFLIVLLFSYFFNLTSLASSCITRYSTIYKNKGSWLHNSNHWKKGKNSNDFFCTSPCIPSGESMSVCGKKLVSAIMHNPACLHSSRGRKKDNHNRYFLFFTLFYPPLAVDRTLLPLSG